MKSFKESKCVSRRPKKHAYVQTGLPSAKPQYVKPVINSAYPQPPAAHGYQSVGHSSPVEPPDYTQAVHGHNASQSEPPANSYYPPPQQGPDPRSPPSTSAQQPGPADQSRPKSPTEQDVRPKSPQKQSEQSQTKKARPSLISRTESQERSHTPEPDNKSLESDSSEKAKSPGEGRKSPSEGSFKLFGLLKKEEKPKEEPVAMVSSQRSLEEDEEQYPEGKNPFDEDEEDNMSDGGAAGFEWDPNNRG